MAVPATIAPRSEAVIRFLRAAAQLKQRCEQFNARAAAGSIPTTAVLELLAELRDARALIDQLPRTEAFRDYAQELLGDGGYLGDIRADAAALRAAIEACGATIAANANTIWAGFSIDAKSWTEQQPLRSPAQTAVLRGLVDQIVAAIG